MVTTRKDYSVAIWSMWALSMVFLTVAFMGYVYRPKEIHEFAVVVDISSYDIELNLYKWKNNLRIKKTAKVEKKYTFSCDINVHKKNLDFDKLREAMFKCVRLVTAQLQDFELYNSTIFIYGTELTRLLCQTDLGKCNNVFSIVSEVLNAFDVHLSFRNIKSLTGYQEAMFGWVSVNEYFNRIQSPKRDLPTLGALDMKNYSFLLSFEDPSVKHIESQYDGSKYTLYGHTYNIHGIDMMCYGLIQALDLSTVNLIKTLSRSAGTIRHPCLPTYYSQNIITEDLFTPCVKKPVIDMKKSYKVVGAWNLATCKVLINETLDEINKDRIVNISSVVSNFNFTNKTFLAFSRVSEIASSINFDKVNLKDLYDDAIKICSSSTKTTIKSVCFDLIYSYTLIVDNLKIGGENVLIGHKEKIETVSGSVICNSRSLNPRKCGCIIGKYGVWSLCFSVLTFGGLGIFLAYKARQNDKMERIY